MALPGLPGTTDRAALLRQSEGQVPDPSAACLQLLNAAFSSYTILAYSHAEALGDALLRGSSRNTRCNCSGCLVAVWRAVPKFGGLFAREGDAFPAIRDSTSISSIRGSRRASAGNQTIPLYLSESVAPGLSQWNGSRLPLRPFSRISGGKLYSVRSSSPSRARSRRMTSFPCMRCIPISFVIDAAPA